MKLFAVENESGWQRTAQLPQAFERLLAAPIAADLELAAASDLNLDVITFFEFKCFYDCGR
ncbi:MAG: hypothetical protein WCC99_08225 [Candidatus Sulfotelmatobacter sp.]